MWTRVTLLSALACLAAAIVNMTTQAQAQNADAAAWRIAKSSGSVWVMTVGAQPASLGDQTQLRPGDSIRTGNNGRVLLERGKETILIAPNSALNIPAAQKDPASTTIVQQSGSIQLQVEKRNVRNFEVETPFLVAAVKGTQFTVTVNRNDASVQVSGGSVEVTSFKSGDHALVAPGQTAKVAANGSGGLSLSGTGTLSPIQPGQPRPSPVKPLTVPRNGLSPPHDAPAWHHVRAHGAPGGARFADANHKGVVRGPGGTIHIGAALGEIKLDIHRVTHGLARGNTAAIKNGAVKQSIWNTGELLPGNGVAKNYNQGNNGSGSGAGSVGGAGSGNGNAGGAASAGGNANGVGNGGMNGLVNGNGNVNANGNGANNNNGNGNKIGHHKI